MTDELPNVRTLTSNVSKDMVRYAECVRISKNRCYESPYAVTGSIQHTGSEEAPKGIPMIGLSGRGKLTTSVLTVLQPDMMFTTKRGEIPTISVFMSVKVVP